MLSCLLPNPIPMREFHRENSHHRTVLYSDITGPGVKCVICIAYLQPHSLRLYAASLNFATTNSSSDGPAEEPLQEVMYVEQCSCPSNRIGANCETCANGYTIDPPFGGEFARCVRCFCSFHSDSCDPVSGECSNCTENTMGPDCEQCVEGYSRAQPLTILPCDRCVEGYWDSGDGVCTREFIRYTAN